MLPLRAGRAPPPPPSTSRSCLAHCLLFSSFQESFQPNSISHGLITSNFLPISPHSMTIIFSEELCHCVVCFSMFCEQNCARNPISPERNSAFQDNDFVPKMETSQEFKRRQYSSETPLQSSPRTCCLFRRTTHSRNAPRQFVFSSISHCEEDVISTLVCTCLFLTDLVLQNPDKIPSLDL